MAPAGMSISAGPASSTSTMSSVVDAAGPSAAAPREPFQPSTAVRVEAGALCGDSAKIGRDTSELQSRGHLVCRLLLEKKKRRVRERTGCSRRAPDRTLEPQES